MASKTSMKPKSCPVCKEELKHPRLLPCIHSFCLECLEQYCTSCSKLPGDDVPCPVCKTEFIIPKNGVAGLTVRTHVEEPIPTELCEACSTDESLISATVYCVDCSQKLCERCSVPHRRWKGRSHDVRPLHEIAAQSATGGNYCQEHLERLRIYCFDCQASVCSMCCLEKHNNHKFERAEKVLEQFAGCIEDEISPVTSRIESYTGATAHVEAETNELLDNIQSVEEGIKAKHRQTKQLLRSQEEGLLQNVSAMKSTAVKAAKSRTDQWKVALTDMQSFRTHFLELRTNSPLSELVQGAKDVRTRAKELLQTYVIPDDYRSPRYKFAPVDIEELLTDDQNFIGQVVEGGIGSAQSVHLQTVHERELEKQVKELSISLDKQTARESELEQKVKELTLSVNRQAPHAHELERKVEELTLSFHKQAAAHERELKQYARQSTESQPKDDDDEDGPPDGVQSVKSTSLQRKQQSDSVDSFRQSFLAASVIQTICRPRADVGGVTSVGDELFVLLQQQRDANQVAVYSINDYQLLRHLSVSGLKVDGETDITSCAWNKCLYFSDYNNKCVDRYDLTSSAITKWKVSGSPRGLSVTSSCNLLITCYNKLIELSSSSGQRVREITLQSDIQYPQHAVQLTTGQYVVCHGSFGNRLHRVCVVDVDGKVVRSYGGERGSAGGQLNSPFHMAVDEDSQCIFVADYNNDRVVLLSPTLQLVRYFAVGLASPSRLYLDRATRRLYAGQWYNVTVIQL